ncbi:hypothetical protein [Endozoicomonas lisbonensis]|uniref:Uncharacterized protein n=1 Tax=Endozoicomonas lisbonensis TaxID=3120522 RepID=A0ABV2SPC4_9GAMM
MSLKKTSSVIALSALSFVASASSGTIEWTRDVPTVCGITIDDGSGSILFQDDEGGKPTVFTVKSNSNFQGNQMGAKLSVQVQSKSDNLRDIEEGDTILHVLNSKSQSKSIDQWDGSPNAFIPSGRHESYLEIMKESKDIEGGVASMTTLLTVDCSK